MRKWKGSQLRLFAVVGWVMMSLFSAQPAQAHPADMLFQYHAITLTRGGVEIEWSIYPGYLLVPRTWNEADGNADGQVTSQEAEIWAQRRLIYLSVQIDSSVPVALQLKSVRWPSSLSAFQMGQEVITISLSRAWPLALVGDHTFTLRNQFEPNTSIYAFDIRSDTFDIDNAQEGAGIYTAALAPATGSTGAECRSLADISYFVTEADNAENFKQVSQVDLYYPSPLLAENVILIDTPGIGSTHQHNTDMTLSLLPRCDAAIVVLSVDPPITATEVEFLRALEPHIARWLFVLNKIDYLDQSAVMEARQFLVETLRSKLGVDCPEVFALSARQGLEARRQGDADAWERSGAAELEKVLLSLAATARQQVLGQAAHIKTVNLIAEVDQLLAVQEQALLLPLEELEQKIDVFSGDAEAARGRRREIGDRLVGDEKRLRDNLETAIDILRDKAQAELLKQAQSIGLPLNHNGRMAQLQDAAVRYFEQEREKLRAMMRGELENVLQARSLYAREIRDRLRQDAAGLLRLPRFPSLAEETIVELHEPAWAVDRLSASLSSSLFEELLPASIRRQREAQRLRLFIKEMVVRNLEKVRWWLLRMIQESIRLFSAQVDEQIEATIEQLDRAMRVGRERYHRRANGQQETMASIEVQRQALNQLGSQIEKLCANNSQPIKGTKRPDTKTRVRQRS